MEIRDGLYECKIWEASFDGRFASLMLSATLPISVGAADLKVSNNGAASALAAAQQAAQTALSSCQKKGAMVAVVVVDRAGVPLVMLRDSLAGMHMPEAASRKSMDGRELQEWNE